MNRKKIKKRVKRWVFKQRFKKNPSGEIRHRIHLLNSLIQQHQYSTYLEIGCNNNKTFDLIQARHKVGVDPKKGGTHRMTSNQFFAQNSEFFDLIFVDGLHHASQVIDDVENSLARLNPHGAIVLHDCNPLTEARQIIPRQGKGQWNGDVWQAVVHFRTDPHLDTATGDFDQGCAVIFIRPNSNPLNLAGKTVTYANLASHRQSWLNLLAADEFGRFIQQA